MINVYQLNPLNIFWSHGRDKSLKLRDGEPIERRLQIQAQVKSGDYFITLATKIDDLTRQIETVDDVTAAQLQAIVTDLLHLQSYYSITQKDSSTLK